MKKASKIIALVLSILMLIGFAGCAGSAKSEAKSMSVGILKGPTALGMLKAMNEADQDIEGTKVNYEVSAAPDEVTAKLLNGELNMACIPSNLAAVLYNKTGGKVQFVSTNTLGILYVVENTGEQGEDNNVEEVKDLKSLEGKTIYTSGKGSSVEYFLNYLLDKEKVNVKVEYLSEHSEALAKVMSKKGNIGLLPEPFVTTAKMKSKGAIKTVANLNTVWDAEVENVPMCMTATVVNTEFAKENPNTIKNFLNKYQESIEYVTNESNIDDVAELAVKFEIIPNAEIAKRAIPNCNIVYQSASETKEGLVKLYEIFANYNKAAIGGQMPDDDFWYEAK